MFPSSISFFLKAFLLDPRFYCRLARSITDGRIARAQRYIPPIRRAPSAAALRAVSPLDASATSLLHPSGVPCLPTGAEEPSGHSSETKERTPKASKNCTFISTSTRRKDPAQLPKKTIVTRDDGNEPYAKRFTRIFVSPIGELFPSGELWDAQGHSHRYESVSKTHWYKTKKKAIEAAAARAIDCLNYRSFPLATGDDRFQFGKEGPYDTSDDPESPPRDLPSNIPEQTKQEIRSMRGII